MRSIKVLVSCLIGLLVISGACAPAPAASPAQQTPPPAPAAPVPAVSSPVPEPAPATPAPLPPVTATGPAAFTISNLSVYPQDPGPQQYATVSVDVANTGGEQGTYLVDLKVNGITVATQDVTLAGGTSQTVKVGFDVGKPGPYMVSIGDLSLDLAIVAKMFSDQ